MPRIIRSNSILVDDFTGAPVGLLSENGNEYIFAQVMITGRRRVGSMLTAKPGYNWMFTAGQWYRSGVAISGATSLTYTMVDADAGTDLTFLPTSPSQTSASQRISAGVPSQPTAPTLTVIGATIQAAFTLPTITGGSALTYSRVRFSNGAVVDVPAPLTTATAPATANVPTTATVTAYNQIGASDTSDKSNTVTPSAVTVPATGLQLTGPNTGTTGSASTAFQVSLSPTGGTVTGSVTVTPTPVAGVTFSPTSLSLSTASPSGSFTATSATDGTKLIAITNSGSLANPGAISYATTTASANTPSLRVTSLGNQMPQSKNNTTGTQVMTWKRMANAQTTESMVFTLGNAYLAEQGGGDATYWGMVEWPVGSAPRPILFSGTQLVSVTAKTLLDSDAVSMPGYTAGSIFYVGLWQENLTGTLITDFSIATDEGCRYGTSASNSGAGIAKETTRVTGGGAFGSMPIAIKSVSAKAAVLLLGDSRLFGLYDTKESTTLTGTGIVGKRLEQLGIGYTNWGAKGDKAANWTSNSVMRKSMAPYITHVVIEYGVNDIVINGSTAAFTLTKVQEMIDYWAGLGKVVYVCTVSPNSTTTDAYATVANQSKVATKSDAITAYNNLVRAGLPNVAGYIEVADVDESARDSGVYKAPGITTDGLHNTPAGYLAHKNSGVLTAAMFTIV